MSEIENEAESVDTYFQVDAFARAKRFKGFVGVLRTLVSRGEAIRARELATRAISPYLDYSSLRMLLKFIPRSAATAGDASVLRIAVLGGPTTHQLVELMHLFLESEGISARIFEAEYGLFRQELLSPSPDLSAFRPQVIVLATTARDLARAPHSGMSRKEVANLADEEFVEWQRLWELAVERWGATIIQNTFELPAFSTMGHFGSRFHASREAFIRRVNATFAEKVPSQVMLHDLQTLIVESGAREWFDPRFYLEAKMPCGAECLPHYAHSLVSLVRAIKGKSKKVLVLDLDNTLWGGVVGDAGPGGIVFGQGSGEGEAYLAFQEFCKSLNDRGILLAVCSKNDEAKAREPFLKRSDMVLKPEDFACFVANWIDKAENLRTISQSLQLGLDSFVFVDDNPAERAIVRKFLPAVAVPDIPEDPAGFIQALCTHRYFETVSFTQEDTQRAQYYAQNTQRQTLASQATDLDCFLASLEMVGRVETVSSLNIERATQLVNKSNQFNLTGKRRTLAEVQQLASSRDWVTLTISLRDKFGDHGLISVVFLQRVTDRWVVDTWVMSCRVLQRGVERFVLDAVVRRAQAISARQLDGDYVPTERNGLVKNLYHSLGFEKMETEGEIIRWCYSGIAGHVPASRHIHLEDEL